MSKQNKNLKNVYTSLLGVTLLSVGHIAADSRLFQPEHWSYVPTML